MNSAEAPILAAHGIGLAYREGGGLTKRSKFAALHDVSFTLNRGDNLGVLGRNGCGKSTLLRILAGIIDPSTGSVECAPDVTRALLSLGAGFNPYLSGRDNALLSAMLQGHSKEEALAMLPQIKEFSELGRFFEQPVKAYSSGMRTRLGFTAALFEGVDILLIDEVIAVGDPHFKAKAETAMEEKLRGTKTVVFVSHSVEQIARLCTRALWLDGGKIRALGPTDEVLPLYRDFIQGLNRKLKA